MGSEMCIRDRNSVVIRKWRSDLKLLDALGLVTDCPAVVNRISGKGHISLTWTGGSREKGSRKISQNVSNRSRHTFCYRYGEICVV